MEAGEEGLGDQGEGEGEVYHLFTPSTAYYFTKSHLIIEVGSSGGDGCGRYYTSSGGGNGAMGLGYGITEYPTRHPILMPNLSNKGNPIMGAKAAAVFQAVTGY